MRRWTPGSWIQKTPSPRFPFSSTFRAARRSSSASARRPSGPGPAVFRSPLRGRRRTELGGGRKRNDFRVQRQLCLTAAAAAACRSTKGGRSIAWPWKRNQGRSSAMPPLASVKKTRRRSGRRALRRPACSRLACSRMWNSCPLPHTLSRAWRRGARCSRRRRQSPRRGSRESVECPMRAGRGPGENHDTCGRAMWT